ncbi:MAG TPA: FecR family protein [Polyangiaceae bacterium]|nr:FecR family protein [Polyangiaceae bacterium]
MTGRPFDEPGALLRRLAEEPLASVPEDSAPERRDRLVRSMRASIEGSFERGQQRTRWQRAIVGVAAAAALILLGGALVRERLQDSPPAIAAIAGIDKVSGTVVLTQAGAQRVLSQAERAVHDGDSLQTAAGAQAHLATAKASVKLSESTELRLTRPSAAEERISLRRGRVDVAVEKTVDLKRSVVVETPDAEVVVRGTVFDVRVEPSRSATSTHVHVTRGSVFVLVQGVQVALLSAGQSWSSEGNVVSDMPAGSPPTAGMPVAEVSASAVPAAPTLGLKQAPLATSKEPARKAGTLAEENRLFSAAVEARNRGEAARAAELFGELLANYPQSPLREVARVERFRAFSQAGQSARAAAEARRYLAEHSDGVARKEARDLALSKP